MNEIWPRVRGTRRLTAAPIVEDIKREVKSFLASPLIASWDSEYRQLVTAKRQEFAQTALGSTHWPSGRLEQLIRTIQDAPDRGDPDPIQELSKEQRRALATWLYWSCSNEVLGLRQGRSFKFIGQLLGLEAKWVHGLYLPMQSQLPCPRCAAPARFTVQSIRPDHGSVICECTRCSHVDAYCGKTDLFPLKDSVRMRCSCRSCRDDLTEFVRKARGFGESLVEHVVDWLRSTGDVGGDQARLGWYWMFPDAHNRVDTATLAGARSVFRSLDWDVTAVEEFRQSRSATVIDSVTWADRLANVGLKDGWLVLDDDGVQIERALLRVEVAEAMADIEAGSDWCNGRFDRMMAEGVDDAVLDCMMAINNLDPYAAPVLADGWSYGVKPLMLGGSAGKRVPYVFAFEGKQVGEAWQSVDELRSLVAPAPIEDRVPEILQAVSTVAVDLYLARTAADLNGAVPGITDRLAKIVEAPGRAKLPKLASLVPAELESTAFNYLYWRYASPLGPTGSTSPAVSRSRLRSMAGTAASQSNVGRLTVPIPCSRCSRGATLTLGEVEGLTGDDRLDSQTTIDCSHCGHIDTPKPWWRDEERRLCTCKACLAAGQLHPDAVAKFRGAFIAELASRVRARLDTSKVALPRSREMALHSWGERVYERAISDELLNRAINALASTPAEDVARVLRETCKIEEAYADGDLRMSLLGELAKRKAIAVKSEVPALLLSDRDLALHVMQAFGSPRRNFNSLLSDAPAPAQVLLNDALVLIDCAYRFAHIVVHHVERVTPHDEVPLPSLDGQSTQKRPEPDVLSDAYDRPSSPPLASEVGQEHPMTVETAIAFLKARGYAVIRRPPASSRRNT